MLALLFVMSVLLVPHAGLASSTAKTNQISGQSALRSAPLTQVAGPASVSTGTQTLGQYTVVPEPAQFNANAQLSVTVGFKAKPGLNSFTSSLNNPNSPDYRHYVNTQTLGSMFGISSTEYGLVSGYFESFGLSVTPSNTYLSMQVTGSVSQMEQAFHTTLGAYAMQLKSTGVWQPEFGNASANPGNVSTSPAFYVNTASLSLPTQISSLVSGVVGLSGAVATPNIAMPYGMSPGGIYGNTNNLSAFTSINMSGLESASSYSAQNINSANFAWMPASLASLLLFGYSGGNYQFLFPSTMHVLTGANNLWNGQNTIASQPDQGQGITIGVIEVGGIYPQILQSFSQMVWNDSNHITNNLTVIPVGNFPYGVINAGLIYGWYLETALDIEYIATMAPMAHIDLIAIPNPNFASFDAAYAYAAQYLTTGQNASTSLTITSNSYGSGEVEVALLGSPMYLTVEDTLLETMNAAGITNFFASGDYSGAVSSGAANSAGMPAVSPGSTSVGGGQLTAYGAGGQQFPASSNYFALGYIFVFVPYPPYFEEIPIPAYLTPALGASSFTYWAYSEGLGGTYTGIIGGGFGQSIAETQPWWQNALDTYSTGALTDPVISGPAAFNMSVWVGELGGWQFFYGGTSFATPISAGEWALIQEQVNYAFGTPKTGDINPILFAAHNAHQAGISSLSSSPFLQMSNTGYGFDSAPVNSFNWYYYNLSINEPGDPLLPWWFNTLFNPAGSGWNYLQGLGMINVATLDNELIGQTPSTQHALMNEPFMVLQVTSNGLQPITTLQSGTSYTLQVVLANGQPGGYYNIVAYSDNPNNGTYGGGMATTLQTGSNGQFTYTPQYSNSTSAGSDYGYFSIVSAGSSDWSFQPFAVVQPNLTSGTLTVGVVNAYGQLETSAAEVTMFTTLQAGYYNLWGIGPTEVTLNGEPVTAAVVTETSVNVSQYAIFDPALPVSSYMPGAVLGHWITDQRGTTLFWTDAFLAEINGPLYTQVVTLQASYRGLTSNIVTVYIEPQAGTFYPSVALNSAGNALVGSVAFNGMTNVNYVNISIGSQPGQFVNVSYPGVYYDSTSGLMMSEVGNGIIPVNFTNLPPPGTPIQLNMVAEGANDLSISYSFFGFSFTSLSVQNPIVWSDPVVISNPGMAPTASLVSSASPMVNGNVTLGYAGSWQASGATGTLTVAYGSTVSTLLSTSTLTGSFVWNSANYADGFYTLTYTVSTPTGLHTSSSVVLYVDNTAAQLNADIVQLQAELSSAQATIKTLQGELSSANATIATMQSQINSLNGQIAGLTSQLSAEMAKYNTTAAELASEQASLSSANATIASLQSSLSSDSAMIASQSTQITSLRAQVATLQSELNAKKGFVPPAWYDVFGGAGALLLGVLAAIAALVGVVIGRHSRQAKKAKSPPATLFMGAMVGNSPEMPTYETDDRKN